MLFAVFKITIRWHKENSKIKANPGLLNEYSSLVSTQSNVNPSRAERYHSASITSNKSGHTPEVEVIPSNGAAASSELQEVKPVTSIALKKKLNKADFMFKSIKNETLIKMPGQINGIDFMIKDLENCIVVILDHTA